MISSYLKISIRSLLKSPLFTSLNVFGLALGLAVSLLLFLHVRQELSFDAYHRQADRIYRVVLNTFWDPASPGVLANAPNAVGPAMQAAIPAVAQTARVLKHEFGASAFVTAGEHKLVEEKLYWADPALTEIFDIPSIAGDLKATLSAPNSVALSRSTAIRYFGTSDAVGQTLQIDRMPPLTVGAVFEDFPGNSSFDANVLGSFQSVKWANQRLVWSNASFETWALLGPGAERKTVENQLAALLDKNVAKDDQGFSMWLQPLRDVHLYSSAMRNNYAARPGDPKQVGILGALALAVLLIACFNYMNLATARSQLRFREVGINKTMGASRRQLAGRFYAETAVLTGFSLVLALGLLIMGIPLFNRVADKHLAIQTIFQPEMLGALLGIGMVVVLLAGSYPALFLSAFLPKNLLQTSFRKDTGAGWLRRGLVTTQFAASVALIIGTLVLYRQMQYIQRKNLGFNPEQVVALTTAAAENAAQVRALAESCRQLSGVQSVCQTQTFPGRPASGRTLHRPDNQENGLELWTNHAGPDVEKVLQIKLLAGTSLPDKSPDDTLVHVLLNKTATDFLGLSPEEAIGKKVDCNLGENAYVQGVVEDFHAESLHKPLGAYAFHDAPTERQRFLLVKMNTADVPETMARIEQAFRAALPQSAFEFNFLDDQLDTLYRSERQTASIVFIFSLLSIFICCLGLFGLAAFAAEQRAKEIGIRKVLGASVAGITGLLARDFLRLVLLAIVVATPPAYYFLQRWLGDFAYHIDLEWWIFLAAGLIAAGIALFTVGFQGLQAALANPIKSLRRE